MLQLNTVILNLAIVRHMDFCLLPLQQLNLLIKHKVRYKSKTFLNLSYHCITRSPTYLCSNILITSLRQKKFCYLVHFLSSLNFRSFRGLVMFLLKLSTKLHYHHHLQQPSILSALYHGRKAYKGAV